jgi:hypothetical protein
MFPNPNRTKALRPHFFADPLVSPSVLRDLPSPKTHSGSWCASGTCRTRMPEAPVDEDSQSVPWKVEIGLPRHRAGMLCPPSNPCPSQGCLYYLLRRLVPLAPHLGHQSGALGSCQRIPHLCVYPDEPFDRQIHCGCLHHLTQL